MSSTLFYLISAIITLLFSSLFPLVLCEEALTLEKPAAETQGNGEEHNTQVVAEQKVSEPQAHSFEEEPVDSNWVLVFLNGGNNTGDEPRTYIDITPFQLSGDFFAFLSEIERKLPALREYCYIAPEEHWCRPEGLKIYNWQRQKVQSTEDLRPRDLLFVVMWNESFIWPGLYIGHRVTIEAPIIFTNGTSGSRTVTLETVTLRPRAFVMEEFLTDEECQTIRDLGEKDLKSSTVGLEGTLSTLQRNSRTSWLSPDVDPRVKQLCDRASFVSQTPIIHQEALQLLHYQGGGFYNSHCDYFGEPPCAERPSVTNRFITLLFYLNDVEEGGATSFSRVRGPNDEDDPWKRNTADTRCTAGYISKPMKRKALMFYNLHPPRYRDAPLGDRESEHIACNVTRGEKWAANFWIWNRPRFGDDPEGIYESVHEGEWWQIDASVNEATSDFTVSEGSSPEDGQVDLESQPN